MTLTSPHPGIINFFAAFMSLSMTLRSFRPLIRGLSISSALSHLDMRDPWSFRPLIRGLSISSRNSGSSTALRNSFPSPHPGIINFFVYERIMTSESVKFPSPHPGIINFFGIANGLFYLGLGFPSPHPGIINFFLTAHLLRHLPEEFPSPHPGIINFFFRNCVVGPVLMSFRPLIRGLSISSPCRRPLTPSACRFRPLIRGLSISSR